MNILVTGGAGYIGSHTCVEAIKAGYTVTVFDNLSNSSEESLNRVEKITGVRPRFVKGDICDRAAMAAVFDSEKYDAVIHFAGLKAVGESVAKPWEYYDNNITGTLILLDEMRKHNVFNMVFSSSATVYGNPETVPLTEDCPLSAVSPYGQTKLWLEDMMRAMAAADSRWHTILLRYLHNKNLVPAPSPSGPPGLHPKSCSLPYGQSAFQYSNKRPSAYFPFSRE